MDDQQSQAKEELFSVVNGIVREGQQTGRYPKFTADNKDVSGVYGETETDDTLIYMSSFLQDLVDSGEIPVRLLPNIDPSVVEAMKTDNWHPRVIQARNMLVIMAEDGTFTTDDELSKLLPLLLDSIPFEKKLEESRRTAIYYTITVRELCRADPGIIEMFGGHLDTDSEAYLESRVEADDVFEQLLREKWKPDPEIIEELTWNTIASVMKNKQVEPDQIADFFVAVQANIFKSYVSLRAV